MTEEDPAARRRIAAHVTDHPGIHFRGLVRALDMAPGQVQYHLDRLRSADRVVALEFGGKTHYFDPAVSERDRQVLALARRETARDVLLVLAEDGPCRPGEVADALGVARSTLSYHVDRLVAADLVEKERDAGRVTLRLVDPEEVAGLLRTIRPSLPERVLDRFTRLVDGLLDG